MRRYHNKAGNSGVLAYEAGDDFILIKFIDGTNYLYTNAVTGESHIEQMKKLAVQGEGLSTYISQNVKHRYARKF
jgi:hypothetical protein